MRTHFLAACLVAMTVLVACSDAPRAEPTPAAVESSAGSEDIVIRFGVVTRAEPRLTVQGSQPLIDYLSEATPYRVELRMGRSSEDVELDAGMQDLVTFLEERLVELTPLGVLSYCVADQRFGADVLVQTLGSDGQPRERAVFITLPTSDVDTIDDLTGKRVALGPSHSMLSHVLGVHELERAGVSVETTNLESDAAVYEAVRSGAYDAGVVGERFADDDVRIVHTTRAIPSRPIVVRADFPDAVRASLREALLALDEHPDWDPLFRNGFAPPEDDAYDDVLDILNQQGTRCTGSCHEPVSFGAKR